MEAVFLLTETCDMDVRLVDLLPNSPFRPPDWRWRLAGYLRDQRVRRVPRPWQRDVAVRRVRQFQSALASCQSDAAHLRLARREPALYAAWQLWSADRATLTSELRARILAGQTDDEIAGVMGLAPATVGAFETLFFDVRARLSARRYVMHQVLGPQLHRGFHPTDIAVLWPLFGYFGGPLALDAMISGFEGGHRPERFEELAKFFEQNAQAAMWRKFMVAIKTLPADLKSLRKALRQYVEIRSAESRAAAAKPKSADTNDENWASPATWTTIATLTTAQTGTQSSAQCGPAAATERDASPNFTPKNAPNGRLAHHDADVVRPIALLSDDQAA